MLMKNKEKKKGKGLWFLLFTICLMGAMVASMSQTTINTPEKYMHRILRNVRQEYDLVDVMDMDCSQFACLGYEGVEITIPELGNGERIIVNKYSKESFVKYSQDFYRQTNSIPGMQPIHYYAHENFFFTGTSGIPYQKFIEIVELILEEI